MTRIAGILTFFLFLDSIRAQDTKRADDVTRQIAELSALVHKLQSRVDELEAKVASSPRPGELAQTPPPAAQPALPAQPNTPPVQSNFLSGTSVSFLMDGYYGNNFNNPIGRVNRLRAYDVSSNAFSLNQAAIVKARPILRTANAPASGWICNSARRRKPCRAMPPTNRGPTCTGTSSRRMALM